MMPLYQILKRQSRKTPVFEQFDATRKTFSLEINVIFLTQSRKNLAESRVLANLLSNN
jgi:hypothetical protein